MAQLKACKAENRSGALGPTLASAQPAPNATALLRKWKCPQPGCITSPPLLQAPSPKAAHMDHSKSLLQVLPTVPGSVTGDPGGPSEPSAHSLTTTHLLQVPPPASAVPPTASPGMAAQQPFADPDI